jgi:hypothetical protein
MSTYAGVTFDVVMDDPKQVPVWQQRAFITERVIPYSNNEDVQSVGRSNFKITVPITYEGAGDLATLQAAVGTTRRTLTDFLGSTHTNVLLIEVAQAHRWEYHTRGLAEVTFVREGS